MDTFSPSWQMSRNICDVVVKLWRLEVDFKELNFVARVHCKTGITMYSCNDKLLHLQAGFKSRTHDLATIFVGSMVLLHSER